MKIVTSANGKKTLKISKKEWENLGKQAGIFDKMRGAWEGAKEGWKGEKTTPIQNTIETPNISTQPEPIPVQTTETSQPQENVDSLLKDLFDGMDIRRFYSDDAGVLKGLKGFSQLAKIKKNNFLETIRSLRENDLSNNAIAWTTESIKSINGLLAIIPFENLKEITDKMVRDWFMDGKLEQPKASFIQGFYTTPEKRTEVFMSVINEIKRLVTMIDKTVPLLEQKVKNQTGEKERNFKTQEESLNY